MTHSAAPHSPNRTAQTANALLTSLGSSEGGDYFAGAQYTLADIATSPLYHRAVHLLKGHRDIDIPAILQEHKLDRWHEGLEGWAGRGGVQGRCAVMAILDSRCRGEAAHACAS